MVSEDATEVRLYCYSQAREGKEQAMLKKATTRFEKRLQELHEGLSRPRTHKKIEAIWRIGRLKANSSGAGQHHIRWLPIRRASRRLRSSGNNARLPVPS